MKKPPNDKNRKASIAAFNAVKAKRTALYKQKLMRGQAVLNKLATLRRRNGS